MASCAALESSAAELLTFSDGVSGNNIFFFASVSAEFVERNVLLNKGDFCLWKADDSTRFLSVRREDRSLAHLRIQKSDDDLLHFAAAPMIKVGGYLELLTFFQPHSKLLSKEAAILRRFVNPKDVGVTASDGEIFLHAFLGRFDGYDLYSGTVFAKETRFKSTVKRMHRKDDATKERLLTEFCIVRYLQEKLHNASIQQINALSVRGNENSSFMIAYAESMGRTAAQFIGSRKWALLGEKEKLQMALELVSMLRDMRNVGVLYGNLCLNAIVVHDARFLLTDFSNAIRVDVSDENRSVQLQTEAWGPAQPLRYSNVRFLAPETTKTKNSRISTEIYALGMFLFHFFTGRSPFGGKTDAEVMESFVCGHLRPEVRAENPRLEQLLKRCCALKPEERPNFNGVYEALREMM